MKLASCGAIVHSHCLYELLCLSPTYSKNLLKEWVVGVYNVIGNLHVSTSIFHETHFSLILNEPPRFVTQHRSSIKSPDVTAVWIGEHAR